MATASEHKSPQSALFRCAGGPLAGARILIAEDDFDIALDLSEEIDAAGSHVVGPYTTVEGALWALNTESVDGAILDAQLADHDATPVALALLKRNVPVVIYTGAGLPAGLEGVKAQLRIVMKPDVAGAASALARPLPTTGRGPTDAVSMIADESGNPPNPPDPTIRLLAMALLRRAFELRATRTEHPPRLQHPVLTAERPAEATAEMVAEEQYDDVGK